MLAIRRLLVEPSSLGKGGLTTGRCEILGLFILLLSRRYGKNGEN